MGRGRHPNAKRIPSRLAECLHFGRFLPHLCILEGLLSGGTCPATVLRAPGSLILLFCVFSFRGAVTLAGQASRLSADVNFIQLTAVVRNESGRPVDDLAPSDFLITDQGVTRQLALCEFVGPAGARKHELPRPTPGDAGAGQRGDRPQLARRDAALEHQDVEFLIIVLQPLGFESRQIALRTVRHYLEKSQASNERIAIIDRYQVVVPFTDDRGRILSAIIRLTEKRLLPNAPFAFSADAFQIVRGLKDNAGRKAMVVFTDFDVWPQLWDWVDLALDANVALYPVDARGLITVIPFGDASIQGIPHASIMPHLVGTLMSSRTSSLAWSQGVLAAAAEATGGSFLANNNDLGEIFEKVADHARAYYVLGYYLNDLKADGRFHRITVRVKRPGVRVIARRGYYAPKSFDELSSKQKIPFLYEALMTERPFHDIRIAAQVDIFPKPSEKTPQVAISYELAWTPLSNDASNHRRSVALLGMIQEEGTLREAGRFADVRRWVPQLPSSRPHEPGLATARYNMLTRLAPGEYRLKIVAADLETSTLGSDVFLFYVPKPQEGFLAMSSLVLADTRLEVTVGDNKDVAADSGPQPPSGPASDPLLVGNSRLLPSPTRVFRSDQRIDLFVRLYPLAGDASDIAETWRASVRVLDRAGDVRYGPVPVPVQHHRTGSDGIPLVCTLDLANLDLSEGTPYLVQLLLADVETKHETSASARFLVVPGKIVGRRDPRP